MKMSREIHAKQIELSDISINGIKEMLDFHKEQRGKLRQFEQEKDFAARTDS